MIARLNLIPESHLLARRRTRRVQTWLAACGVYALATVLVVIGMQVALAAEPADLERGLLDVSHMREKMQLQLDYLTAERKKLTQQYAAAKAVGLQPDWSTPLRLLGAGSEGGMVLTRLELSPIMPPEGRATLLAEPQRYQIVVEGLAVSEPALAELVRSAERVGIFSRVRREASTIEEFAGKSAVRFRLVCEIGETPTAASAGAGAAGAGAREAAK